VNRPRFMSDNDEGEAWSVADAIDKLRNAIGQNKQSIENLFTSIDADDDGLINGPELYMGLQKVVGDRLSLDQISMIIKALDKNDDNRIDLNELKSALLSE